jgi:hypothetical protein
MKMRALLLSIVLGAVALAASATPQQHDGNDLWIDPNESGWGLNLFHQGDTLFASLFVYGSNGQPRWYTGSSLAGDDGGPAHDRPSIYTGALYETTGPGIGGPFDPSRVTRRQVGTMTVELATVFPGRNVARVTYDVDGVRVAKELSAFSFARVNLSGTYVGYQSYPGGINDDMTFTINHSGPNVTMASQGSSSGTCNYSGTHAQNGHLANVTGTYSCNDGRTGSFSMLDVDVTKHGITSRFEGNRIPASMNGSMVGQRTTASIRGDGWRTDLWWAPAESGWGFNVIEQGDNLFGTLFVYDGSGQPRWYSASDLAYNAAASPPPDAASDSSGKYTGTLYESTGPYFGTSFNPAAVTRRQVGTIAFEVFGDRTGYLTYTIDGVTLTRKPLDRATFRANSLSGTYIGHMTSQNNNDRGVPTGAMTMEVSDTASGITIVTRGSRGECTLTAARSSATQFGHLLRLAGNYTCGGTTLGGMNLEEVEVSYPGFTGRFGLDGYPIGRIEAARTTAH